MRELVEALVLKQGLTMRMELSGARMAVGAAIVKRPDIRDGCQQAQREVLGPIGPSFLARE